jgi:hypothetical protein
MSYVFMAWCFTHPLVTAQKTLYCASEKCARYEDASIGACIVTYLPHPPKGFRGSSQSFHTKAETLLLYAYVPVQTPSKEY